MTAYSDLEAAPRKHYGLIYIDPAWKFKTYASQEKSRHRRDAERYYPTMTFEEMAALDVRAVAAKNCFMVMWTSFPHLPKAMDLIKAYRFKYVSSFVVWAKTKKSFSPTKAFITNPQDFHTGTGYTSRKNVEICLLAKCGSPKRMAKDVRELLVTPVREHSRKPDELYELLERFAAGPYLEMNARTERPGWDQWGNEVQKFLHPAPKVALVPEEEPEQQHLFEPFRTLVPRPEPDYSPFNDNNEEAA